jgi:acyl-coenzyme A synthetase/AMP-(fatty) acid ligase
VGKIDDLKGEIPIGFVVLRSLDNLDEKFLEKELV